MSDLIKREDAIEELADYMYDVALLKADGRLNTTKHYLKLAEASLKHIPSADRPQAEWEIYVISPFDGEDCRCSLCGETGCAPYWNYCPHCGARMVSK